MSSDRVYPWSNKFDKALVRARYRFAREVMAKLSLSRTPLRVLDVGSGYGIGLRELLDHKINVVAVDIERNCTKYVHHSVSPTMIDVVTCDALMLPFRRGAFHAVLVMDIIEHVHDPEKLLRETCRVVKPPGLLILSTPNKSVVRHNPHHVREFSVSELIDLVSRVCTCRIIGVFGQVPVNRLLSLVSKLLRVDIVYKFARFLPGHEIADITDLLSENDLVNMFSCEVYRCGVLRDFAHIIAVALVS